MRALSPSLLFLASLCFTLASCSEDSPATDDPLTPDDQDIISEYLHIQLSSVDDYQTIVYPIHYDDAVISQNDSPTANPITNEGATLGRVLFYDKRLSQNNTVSCASCHAQEIGFSDSQVLSDGFEGGKTGAHAMRLLNISFYTGRSMFWDKRAADIEGQSTEPIQDATEMGFDESHGGFSALTEKMEAIPYYPILFKQVYGDEGISESRVQLALGQFMRSMVSTNSKFDEGFAQVYNANAPANALGADFPNYTAAENLGKSLFLAPPNAGGAGCAGCHQPPSFALDANSRSNGLDQGESTIFKSPSLKSIHVGGPYMHDGRFSTLEEVVAHYNNGIAVGPALDQRLRAPQGNPLRLNLTVEEQNAIVAFLKTLDDEAIAVDTRFSDPFK